MKILYCIFIDVFFVVELHVPFYHLIELILGVYLWRVVCDRNKVKSGPDCEYIVGEKLCPLSQKKSALLWIPEVKGVGERRKAGAEPEAVQRRASPRFGSVARFRFNPFKLRSAARLANKNRPATLPPSQITGNVSSIYRLVHEPLDTQFRQHAPVCGKLPISRSAAENVKTQL